MNCGEIVKQITSSTAFKISIFIFIILLIAANIRLVVFLYNVNRDLDDIYYRISLLDTEDKAIRNSNNYASDFRQINSNFQLINKRLYQLETYVFGP